MLADLDHQLRELTVAVGRIRGNLLDLETDPTCALLDQADLRGASATRWLGARVARAELFEWLGHLTALVDEAASLRGGRRTLPPDREDALRELLGGPSIVLSTDLTPLAERTLLASSRATERCSATDLLTRMTTSFDEVRRAIADAREVFEIVVPRLGEIRARMLELMQAADEPDLLDVDLGVVQEDHRALAEEALADPLSVDRDQIARLEAVVASAARQADDRRQLRSHASDRIAGAQARCRELHALVEESEDLHRAVVARVLVPAAPAVASVDPDIDARLQLVERLAGRGDWRATQRELESVEQRVNAAILEVRARASSMRSILEERSRLRGLLDAYMAKAAALGRLEDRRVAERYRAAHDALYVAPSDLEAARLLISDYRRSLEDVATRTAEGEVPR